MYFFFKLEYFSLSSYGSVKNVIIFFFQPSDVCIDTLTKTDNSKNSQVRIQSIFKNVLKF